MSGIIGGSKTTNNQSSLINSGSDLVVNSIQTTDAISTGPIVSSGAISSNSLTTSGNITSTSGNIVSPKSYSDKFYVTTGGSSVTGKSEIFLNATNQVMEIWGYNNMSDAYNSRKIKLRDYVELKYLYCVNGMAINTTPDNFSYKFNCNGNANITGSLDVSGNFTNTGTVSTSGLVTNSIVSSGTTGPLIIDPNFTTNNHVLIHDKLVVSGSIEGTSINVNNSYCSAYGSQGGPLSINSPFTLYLNSGNNNDIVYNSNRHFFLTQGGGNIMCAINWGMGAGNGNYSLTINGCIYAWGATLGSDDRVKGEEVFITDATATLLKLRPQTYNKYNDFSCSGDHIKETGLIAQEIYYDAPELRHIVTVPQDSTFDPNVNIPSSLDPSKDPAEYSSWGSTPAGVAYIQLIPYLVKSIQELHTEIQALKTRLDILEA